MPQKQDVRFIRKNGRVIPIRVKKQDALDIGKTVTLAAGSTAVGTLGAVALRSRGIKQSVKAGEYRLRANTYGKISKKRPGFKSTQSRMLNLAKKSSKAAKLSFKLSKGLAAGSLLISGTALGNIIDSKLGRDSDSVERKFSIQASGYGLAAIAAQTTRIANRRFKIVPSLNKLREIRKLRKKAGI